MLGNERAVASAVGEILPHAEWYDYAAKYDEGGSDIIVARPTFPSPWPNACATSPCDAFRALELSGMARVDCFLTPHGEVLVNEVNTIPGFTSTSVYARLFDAAGVGTPRCSTGSCSARSTATRGARATATDQHPRRDSRASGPAAATDARPVLRPSRAAPR